MSNKVEKQYISSSYLTATAHQVCKGLEQYGLVVPQFSSDFLEIEFKKPHSSIKDHLFNALVNSKLVEEIQQFLLSTQQLQAKLSREKAEEADEEYKAGKSNLPEILPIEQAEPEKITDIQLFKLRQEHAKLVEQYEKLAQGLYKQQKSQTEATEEFHTEMDEVFHTQANAAVEVLESSLANLETQAADATTNEEKEQLQAKILPLREVLNDFNASIKRESIAVRMMKQDMAESNDPIKMVSMIHHHIMIQQMKLALLEMQLKNLQFAGLASITEIFQNYGAEYTKHYLSLKEQIHQTKNLIQEMKQIQNEILAVDEQIAQHSANPTTRPYRSPKFAPSMAARPRDDEDELQQNYPTPQN